MTPVGTLPMTCPNQAAKSKQNLDYTASLCDFKICPLNSDFCLLNPVSYIFICIFLEGEY